MRCQMEVINQTTIGYPNAGTTNKHQPSLEEKQWIRIRFPSLSLFRDEIIPDSHSAQRNWARTTYDLELSFEGPALSHACSRSGTWRCPFRTSNHVQQISAPLVGCFLSGQGVVARLRVDGREIQRCGVRRYRDLTAGYSSEGMRMTALENEWNQEKRRANGSITR